MQVVTNVTLDANSGALLVEKRDIAVQPPRTVRVKIPVVVYDNGAWCAWRVSADGDDAFARADAMRIARQISPALQCGDVVCWVCADVPIPESTVVRGIAAQSSEDHNG